MYNANGTHAQAQTLRRMEADTDWRRHRDLIASELGWSEIISCDLQF